MDSHPRLLLAGAFIAGILLTLGYKDVYPDLERRFREARSRRASQHHRSDSISSIASRQRVSMKDNTSRSTATTALQDPIFPEGIEGCIGNTPLFKIKSLSDATGCEILAKAEVL